MPARGKKLNNSKRCSWAATDNPLYIQYHDKEWGVPVHDDRKQFEMLVLEGAQAGLSWSTVLKKRENYRKAFDGFSARKVARYDARKVKDLMSDKGLIRNRIKINSAIRNARVFLRIQDEFGSFSRYIWSFVGGKPIKNKRKKPSDLPAKTRLSEKISKDLQKRGMTFVGPTIIYAHMQATGLVNDHQVNCFRYDQV